MSSSSRTLRGHFCTNNFTCAGATAHGPEGCDVACVHCGYTPQGGEVTNLRCPACFRLYDNRGGGDGAGMVRRVTPPRPCPPATARLFRLAHRHDRQRPLALCA